MRPIVRALTLRDQQLHSSCARLRRNLTGVVAETYWEARPWLSHSDAMSRQPGQFTWHASLQSGEQTSRQNHVMFIRDPFACGAISGRLGPRASEITDHLRRGDEAAFTVSTLLGVH
jgi:hypothetical protein